MPSIKKDPPSFPFVCDICHTKNVFLAPSGAQGVSLSVCLSVRLSVQHKFVCSSEFSSFFHRSVSGKSQVSLRSVSGQSQVGLRSVSGQSQVSLR